MSLALVQGYSSEEEETPQEAFRTDSDEDSDENEKRNEYPKQKLSMPLQPTKGSLLPSAFDAFSEVTGPPEFLNNSASEPIPTRPSEKRNSFGGWQAAKDPRTKKEPRAGTTLTCCLQKGRNCIAIESDPIQCSFIQQRINAIPALPDEIQEVGLRKGDFTESKVAKLSKEPQVPLGEMIGKNHFGELAYIKEPMEEQNDTMEAQNDVEEEDDVFVEHDEFGIYDIFD